jgi:hypothetical protein
VAVKRVALVIGNSGYDNGKPVSGVKDAEKMTACLQQLKFESVTTVFDLGLDGVAPMLADFKAQMADATLVVFFYSGHGFQSQGSNFLVPVDGDVIPAASLPVDTVLQALVAAPANALKLVILDACRNDDRLGPDALQGLAKPGAAPPNVLQAFAASSGQVAASGSADGLSPYTTALLRYLPQPGLALNEIFDKVHTNVLRDYSPQEPIVAGALPVDFFFRDPVFIPMDFPEGKSELLVFLRGGLFLDTSQPVTKDSTGQPVKPTLRLNAGVNQVVLLVSNGRAHRNNHDWDITEGWSYELHLTLPDGTVQSFTGSEDIPFKDGPHYGKVFRVAQVNLQVDEQTGVLTPLDLQTDLANQEAPFYARDQEVLVQVSIADLNLSPDDILGDTLGNLPAFLKPFLVEFLKSGTILGTTIADPTKTFVTVLGNAALKSLAAACMADRPARIADLKASIAAVFRRDPTPFKAFDQGLMACMRAQAQSQGSPLQPDDIQAWTALRDLSNQPPAVATAAAAAVSAPVPVPVG